VLLELYRDDTPDFADRLAENTKLLQNFFDTRYNILT
jgi:hypothetical protein